MRKSLVPVLALALSACAGTPPVETTGAFDPEEVAWFHNAGTNTIVGNAVLRTVSGETRTCAAMPAYLVPVSRYARERVMKIYGNAESGFLPVQSDLKFAKTDPLYESNSKSVKCDALGNFRFENIPDGEYYVTATVVWGVPTGYFISRQGGVLMQHVSVKGGETKNIVLST